MHIRKARVEESQVLTALSYESKGYWNYPPEYFEAWRDELTITSDYIAQNIVYVAEINGAIIGYYSVVRLSQDQEVVGIILEKGFWLEHLFILTDSIGKKIGTELICHMVLVCQELGIKEICVLADPNALGFYEKMGFRYEKKVPSTIPDRTTPLLIKEI